MSKPTPPAAVLELTPRVVILGIILSVVMGAANVYLGLKAGMTVSASIPAAVVGMLVLRHLFKGGTILEANQVQTAASAGESLAAGIIFTMPALLLIGVWDSFDFWTTTIIAFTGGLLGILFMIPMRRVFVVDNDELPFPEGVACASVLRAADESGGEAMSVVQGGLIGASLKFAITFIGALKGSLEGAMLSGGRIFFFGADISPALVGVGYIVRLNVAALIFIGGALGWLVCIPLLPELSALIESVWPGHQGGAALEEGAVDAAWSIWSSKIRYVGVGAMVVGGIVSIVKVRHGLVRAIAELRGRFGHPSAEVEATDRDLPTGAIAGLSVLAVALITGVYFHFTQDVAITGVTTLIMVVMAFFFVAVASYIVGLVGNSNSPVSGMTITAVLFTGGMLSVLGFGGTSGMVATLGVAAIVCCAACTSGDVCNDLKTGSIVGATPQKQQIMQIVGVAFASLAMAPILQLLHEAFTIGSRELPAPQAGLFAQLAEGFFGDRPLPWGMVALGAALGLAIQAIDAILERRKSSFRMHLMPVAVGMYLPFGLSVPILLGGLMAHLQGRGTEPGEAMDRKLQRGVLFSSGIIAGEALVGVLIAILFSAGISGMGLEYPGQGLATFGVSLAVMASFWFLTRPREPA